MMGVCIVMSLYTLLGFGQCLQVVLMYWLSQGILVIPAIWLQEIGF
jgi:hypothetical protein